MRYAKGTKRQGFWLLTRYEEARNIVDISAGGPGRRYLIYRVAAADDTSCWVDLYPECQVCLRLEEEAFRTD